MQNETPPKSGAAFRNDNRESHANQSLCARSRLLLIQKNPLGVL